MYNIIIETSTIYIEYIPASYRIYYINDACDALDYNVYTHQGHMTCSSWSV